MKKLLLILLISSFCFSNENTIVIPCEGTCLTEEETKGIFNNIKELQFDLDKSSNLNIQYESLIKDYETQIKLKDEICEYCYVRHFPCLFFNDLPIGNDYLK